MTTYEILFTLAVAAVFAACDCVTENGFDGRYDGERKVSTRTTATGRSRAATPRPRATARTNRPARQHDGRDPEQRDPLEREARRRGERRRRDARPKTIRRLESSGETTVGARVIRHAIVLDALTDDNSSATGTYEATVSDASRSCTRQFRIQAVRLQR